MRIVLATLIVFLFQNAYGNRIVELTENLAAAAKGAEDLNGESRQVIEGHLEAAIQAMSDNGVAVKMFGTEPSEIYTCDRRFTTGVNLDLTNLDRLGNIVKRKQTVTRKGVDWESCGSELGKTRLAPHLKGVCNCEEFSGRNQPLYLKLNIYNRGNGEYVRRFLLDNIPDINGNGFSRCEEIKQGLNFCEK